MASINLLVQSKKNPAVIYIRLRDGKKIDIKAKTNYSIDPLNWDPIEQRPNKKLLKDIDFANLDTELSTLKTDVLKNYNKSKGIVSIDFEWLKNTINPPNEEDKLPETLVDYISLYTEYKKRDVKASTIAKCNVNKEILIDENLINNLSWVKSTIKHEIIHAIENISIPNNNDELYLMPQQSRSDLFRGDWVENQEPLEVQKLRKQLEDKYYYYIVDREVNITVVEARKKAKKMADKAIRELDKRAKSIHGDFDMYFANPSELRAFRAEFDNLFSLENLKTVYHQIYENLDNGKELFLSGFYELIQRIASVDDLSESYQNSFY